MKLLHLSDLHLGKRVNEFSMLEDQKYILGQILQITDQEKPDCVIIAGDIYDKSVAPAEAVEVFDDFLVELSRRGVQTCLISGNHDSAERLAFGGRLMAASRVFPAPVYAGKVEAVRLEDAFGTVNIWLLPFVKPAHVRRFFPEEKIESYTDAIRVALSGIEIQPGSRNVLVTHQFVIGAERSESEQISVGGSDNVDASVFDGFDYVALGHIHGPQNIGSPRIRYCGTPLKYSFSEASHEKSVTIAELGEKGTLQIRTVALQPLHDMVQLRGTYASLTARAFYSGTTYRDDYVRITLTDEEDIPDAIAKLRVIYRNLMRLDYDNLRTRSQQAIDAPDNLPQQSELELFARFYEIQNNSPLSEQQRSYLERVIDKLKEDAQ